MLNLLLRLTVEPALTQNICIKEVGSSSLLLFPNHWSQSTAHPAHPGHNTAVAQQSHTQHESVSLTNCMCCHFWRLASGPQPIVLNMHT